MFHDRFASALAMVAVAAIISPSSLTAQITFQRTYGGPDEDRAFSVQQTSDGGYILGGDTKSFGAGDYDAYVIKVGALGDTQWTRTYGGEQADAMSSVYQTLDGGYVMAGVTFSTGDPDIYLVRTDAVGDTLWTKTFGDAGDEDWARQVRQTADSGYVVVGHTWFRDSAYPDIRVIRLDGRGNTQWDRTYGGPLAEHGYAIRQSSDSGHVVVGSTMSFGAGQLDVYLVKLDPAGDTVWTRTFGDTISDEGYGVEQTTDGGYIVAGRTSFRAEDDGDVYLIRTNAAGDMLWAGDYGGQSYDQGCTAQQISEDAYVVAGGTESYGAGGRDVYLIKTDADGDTLWTRTFGGLSDDYAWSSAAITDGGFVIAGLTRSFGAGESDVYLIKTDSLGEVAVAEPKTSPMRTRGLTVFCEPNPFAGTATIRLSPSA
jgi:hypothetical protein